MIKWNIRIWYTIRQTNESYYSSGPCQLISANGCVIFGAFSQHGFLRENIREILSVRYQLRPFYIFISSGWPTRRHQKCSCADHLFTYRETQLTWRDTGISNSCILDHFLKHSSDFSLFLVRHLAQCLFFFFLPLRYILWSSLINLY